MMISKLKIGVVAVVLLGMAAVLFFQQQQQIKRLIDENADLRAQLSQMASLRESNRHLADESKAIVESSQASQKELMRLRGQAVRLHQLEQENAQLKSQRQQLDRQTQQAQVTAVSEVIKAGSGFSKANTTDLGLLELSEGTPTRFDLGGGTNCVVTPTATPDGNATVEIAMGITNADGTVSELGTSRITARPGQHCSISVGDRMIALAVKLKTQ